MNEKNLVGEIVNKNDPMEAFILRAKKCVLSTGVEDGYILLCFAPSRKEFITWWMNNDNATSSGHYFTNLIDALIHFKSRN